MDANESAMLIASRIKARREELGYSYQELANICGLSKSTLQRYETGFIMSIPLNKIEILATALRTSPEYILGWEKAPAAQGDEGASQEDVEAFANDLRLFLVRHGFLRDGQDLTDEQVEGLSTVLKAFFHSGK